jgi:DNA-binding NarL/FixJ family response regulator
LIALKLIQANDPTPSPAQINHALTLTKREQHTLALLAKGLSNLEIGSKLIVHERTIAKIVSNILDKPQLANRTQTATYTIREG